VIQFGKLARQQGWMADGGGDQACRCFLQPLGSSVDYPVLPDWFTECLKIALEVPKSPSSYIVGGARIVPQGTFGATRT
jgi:hypothetical protein